MVFGLLPLCLICPLFIIMMCPFYYSCSLPPTFGIINVELEVGHVDESRVLVDIHHVWVQLRQVQKVLHEANQCQLHRELRRNKQDGEVNVNNCLPSSFSHSSGSTVGGTYYFPEGPVVGRVGVGGEGPVPQHCSGHHCVLHLLYNIPQHLMGGL